MRLFSFQRHIPFLGEKPCELAVLTPLEFVDEQWRRPPRVEILESSWGNVPIAAATQQKMNDTAVIRASALRTLSGLLLLIAGIVLLFVTVFFLLAVLYDGFQKPFVFGLVASGGASLVALWGARRLFPRAPVCGIAVSTFVFAFLVLGFMIVAPSMVGSPSRSRQKRTMADLRSIATALEAYAIDFENSYPDVHKPEELQPFLVPTYIRSLPTVDGWENPLRYQHALTPDGKHSYILGSAGDDGKWEKSSLSEYTERATTHFDHDIVYRDGFFLQYPEGTQVR